MLWLVYVELEVVSSLVTPEPKLRDRLGGHIGHIQGVAFTPNSKTLASGSYETTVKLWDMTSGIGTGSQPSVHSSEKLGPHPP